jgi:hypothetical protein
MNVLNPMKNSAIWQRAKSSYLLIIFILAVLILSLQDQDSFHVLLKVLSDAYIAVSVFVAFTLVIFYTLESAFKVNTKDFLKKHQHFQVPIAALLGALPGCGGAIIVVTQYVRGRLSFGSVVAVLTATMGDAAFLLLAQAPQTGFLIMGLGVCVGVISGYGVDALHGQDYLRPKDDDITRAKCLDDGNASTLRLSVFDGLWLLLVGPGFVLGILNALQIGAIGALSAEMHGAIALYLGATGAVLGSMMWVYSSVFREHRAGEQYGAAHNIHMSSEKDHPVHRVIQDTNFVTTWVVFAFFIFEMTIHITQIDLANLFSGVQLYLPLIAILIGFIPGCGPQILVTATYLSGAIPLSAQIGNAISNDGDALFPAIALAPRAAVVATVYSALPAFVAAYGYMWLFES